MFRSIWFWTILLVITVIVLSVVFFLRHRRNKTSEPGIPSEQGWIKKVWQSCKHSLSSKMTGVLLILLLFYVFLIVSGVILTVLTGINLWVVMFVISMCHYLASIKVVGEQEVGVLIIFGRIIREYESGPVLAPWPMRLRKVTKNSIQVEFGTIDSGTEQKKRADKSDDSLSWFVMKEPIRINWGDIRSYPGVTKELQEEYRNDPYAQRLTTDPHLYFRIKVCDFARLISRVGGLEEALERIKDTCVTALQELAGQTFVALAIKQIPDLSRVLKARVEVLVADPQAIARGEASEEEAWGIDIEEVRIKDLGTPRRTNEAVADLAKSIATADGEARAAIRKAEGAMDASIREAATIRNLADANKDRVTKEGEARAQAMKAVIDASNNPTGQLILKLDALKDGLQKGKVVVIPANLGGLFSGALGVSEALGLQDPDATETDQSSTKK